MKNKILPIIAILFVIIAVVIILVLPKNNTANYEDTNISVSNNIENTLLNSTVDTASKIEGSFNENGDLVIKVDELDSKNVTFINAKIDNQEIELIAIKDEENNIDVAFNTCQVCNGSPKAYFVQKNGKLICENCKNSFSFKSIGGDSNGCNPITINEDYITKTDIGISINKEYLSANSDLFLNVATH